jgi:hypothetical protein
VAGVLGVLGVGPGVVTVRVGGVFCGLATAGELGVLGVARLRGRLRKGRPTGAVTLALLMVVRSRRGCRLRRRRRVVRVIAVIAVIAVTVVRVLVGVVHVEGTRSSGVWNELRASLRPHRTHHAQQKGTAVPRLACPCGRPQDRCRPSSRISYSA